MELVETNPGVCAPLPPPPVHTLPIGNHLMHVLLLSLVNHKWGMGSSLLQSTPPKTHTHIRTSRCMEGKSCKKVHDLQEGSCVKIFEGLMCRLIWRDECQRLLSEAVIRAELKMCQWVGQQERKGRGCEG